MRAALRDAGARGDGSNAGPFLACVAESIDAEALALAVVRDGALAISDITLDARHRDIRTKVAAELRLAASEALRGGGSYAERCASLAGAVCFASGFPDGTGAVAGLCTDGAKVAKARAVLELVAFALQSVRGGREATAATTFAALVARLGRDVPADPVEMAAQLRSAFEARRAPTMHSADATRPSARRRSRRRNWRASKARRLAERDLLDWQIAQLDLKSPVDGLVLLSPLEHSAGAPVREGDVIAEISPIDRLRVRVDVPVEDLDRLEAASEGLLHLDGRSGEPVALSRFSRAARAETIDGHTVFPLRTTIDNPGLELRPGQKGVVLLPTGSARIGEILFRKAWNAFRRWTL